MADEGGVSRRLRSLLLGAYADGTDPAGRWELRHVRAMVPDLQVTVRRADGGPDGDGLRTVGDPGAFSRRLQSTLLSAYADGDDLDGVWRVYTEPPELPDWEVTVVVLDEEREQPPASVSR